MKKRYNTRNTYIHSSTHLEYSSYKKHQTWDYMDIIHYEEEYGIYV